MKFYLPLLLTAAFAISVGCNSQATLGTIHGKVTSDGAPVTEATISFRNIDTGESISDELDDQGLFDITAAGGIKPGKYKVAIIPPEVEVSRGPNSSPVLQPKEMPNLPKQYRSMNTTPLVQEVVAGENDFSIELKP